MPKATPLHYLRAIVYAAGFYPVALFSSTFFAVQERVGPVRVHSGRDEVGLFSPLAGG